ncbi:BTAD domain-containing putative transcriptional regulator [Streptomyces sp. HPF1205]|uniref:AfsR/SARP family transcriptional regulator n=1 Tax=Streptomyces sp. HPF1205 TaxID=2873262 RepID=UPI001CEDABC2|nr:BTAD domain-containing putative transcriptional regulator [Streptomyces sp. HPF1205]
MILGTTQVLRDDGTPVALAGGRLRALLTALALRPGRVIGADALIDEVWDGEAPAGATGALQALVGRLRKAIGHEAVGSVDGGYRLEAAPEDVDLHRFGRLAEEGARALADGDPVKAVGLLGDALALWRGPALADLPDRATAAVRTESLRLDTARHRITAELALGRADRVLPDLAELVAAHPLDEPLRALHIRALRAVGRTADALAAYEAVRVELADRLGTDPSAELRALHAELLNPRDAAGAPGGSPWAAAGRAAAGLAGGDSIASAGGTTGAPPSPGPRADGPRGSDGAWAEGAGGAWAGSSWAGSSWAEGTADGTGRAVAGGRAAVGPRTDGSGPSGRPDGQRRPGAGPRPVGNARARLTSFVGREGELAAVREDLEHARLVTITGPGGTGKTRLSQETGDQVADRWPDGVWYAELAPVSDPRTLPEAVISSLGLRETLLHAGGAAEAAIAAEIKPKDPTSQLADYCAGRSLLLVLDNCEHVIDAAATLTERLLAACPGVSVLATSREPLGVPGELVRPLDPLPDPTALRLLADRGAAARPGFRVDDDPVACAELCRRLDGLPLAIELAAARLRSLSPRQLADRLDDRFRLLTGGSRTLLPRQQTLRAVVDWSWDLLHPAERVLLRRLAVFRGGCTLEAVESICADPGEPVVAAAGPAAAGPGRIEAADAAALLASLVDKSLVLADLTPDGGRYRMLETIGEYAAERLEESGEREAVERRHIAYYREYARTADPRLRGAGQRVWFDRLEREHENLRAALRRAVAAGDEQEALVLTLSCAWFWEVRNYVSERRRWPAAVAAMGPDPFEHPPALEPVERGPLDDPPPLTGQRLIEARRWVRVVDMAAAEGEVEWWTDPALVAVGQSMIAAYPPHLPQSARPPGILRAYGAFFSGDFDRLRTLVDDTVEACRLHGRDWELAFSLQLRAKINNDAAERLPLSLRDIEESRGIFQRLGDQWGTAETLAAEAEAASNSGDWERAAACCREGGELARAIGSHQHVPVFTVRLGDALANCGQVEEGERLLRQAIEEADGFGATADGTAFYGRVLLANLLRNRGAYGEALDVIESAITTHETGKGRSGVPGFVSSLLYAMKGTLIGRLGEPEAGIALFTSAMNDLVAHPLAEVITPRIGILLTPGAIELLVLLAERDTAPAGGGEAHGGDAAGGAEAHGGDAAGAKALARARRAAVLAGAHDRLRPTAAPPAETRSLHAVVTRVRALLGDEAYEAAYAEGGGLTSEEAAPLMRDVD